MIVKVSSLCQGWDSIANDWLWFILNSYVTNELSREKEAHLNHFFRGNFFEIWYYSLCRKIAWQNFWIVWHYDTSFSDDEVSVECLQNDMLIAIPKSVLRGTDREHIRALDVNCGATDNLTHFILDVPLTGCGTKSRHTNSSVIYSNEALPVPPVAEDIVSHVPDFQIPFHCYYDNEGLVSGVGLMPRSEKVIFSEKGFGKFTMRLELFPDLRFEWDNTDITRSQGVHSQVTVFQSKMVCVVKPASLGKINQALSFFGILIWENYLTHFKQNFSVFLFAKGLSYWVSLENISAV